MHAAVFNSARRALAALRSLLCAQYSATLSTAQTALGSTQAFSTIVHRDRDSAARELERVLAAEFR
jgi:hypothetical protein